MAKQSTSKNNPHDRLFKAVFRRLHHAADLIRALLPEAMIDWLDMDSIRAEPTNKVDHNLHEHFSDLAFSMAFRGHQSRFVAVLEHKSFSKKLVTIDAGGYASDVARAHVESNPANAPPPMVVVMIIYHGKSKWNAPHALSGAWDVPAQAAEIMRAHVYDGAYILLDLADMSRDSLRGKRMNPMATLTLWVLARARTSADIVAELAAELDLFRQVCEQPDGLDDVLLLMRYILHVSDASMDKLKLALLDPLGEQVTEAYMTGAQRLRLEGLQQGLQRGRRQGLHKGLNRGLKQGLDKGLKQGRQLLLLRQLETRFGALPAEVIARVNTADMDDLDTWAVRILSAAELDEVFA